ncbi:nitrate ABC transporter ATPase [Bradyrhizobium sp. NAS96.2]|nr:nitrate ABC transporter ATPase [Bradyrhizobium sp. NAS96.2]
MFEAKPPELGAAPAPSRALLQLAGVSKTFTNRTLALEGVDLTVRPGEFLTLLGASGCGKSTLLKMIAGLSAPTTGTIDWPTSTYDARGEPDRSLGFVFQEPTLLPWRTVFDNVYLPLMLGGARRRDVRERIMEVLAQVGLTRFADAYPRELSGGMRMRVSVARAMATNPRILLMDEPFAALDEITRTKLNNDLLQLFTKNNLTVIFVTHSVYESVYLSSRIAVMRARPGRMSTEIAISAPYPRNEDFRVSPVYNDYCRRASEALRQAMAQSTDEPE